MPKKVEMKLRREGLAKGFSGKRLDAYIYGTMNKLGLMSGNKRTKDHAATLGNKPKKSKKY